MIRSQIGIATMVILLCGELAVAQRPGPYLPPPSAPEGFPGAPPVPSPPLAPNGSPNPRGIPQPMSPDASILPPSYPGAVPQPMPPSGMPFGNANPHMIPQPMPPSGMPFGNANPGGLPMPGPSNGTPYGPPGGMMPPPPGGMMPPPPGGNPGLPPMPGPAPKPGGGEPYMVLPDKLPPSLPPAHEPSPAPVVHPVIQPEAVVLDQGVLPSSYIVPHVPPEPYVLYEGPRYQAQVKEDCLHCWVQGSFVHWWFRQSQVPTLATTGLATNPTAGTLGNPDTAVLIGNGPIGNNEFSGIQAAVGTWLTPDQVQGVELSGFWFARHSGSVTVSSDATGSPPISRPIIDPVVGESIIPVSVPGALVGSLSAQSETELHSAEINFIQNICRVNSWGVDVLVGFRYAYLNDSLVIVQNSTALTAFGSLPAGATASMTDAFSTTNRFYGAQFGMRVNYVFSPFDVSVSAKVGLGATAEQVNIDGFSTINNAGNVSAFHQGVLAQPSNIGQYYNRVFSFLSQVDGTVGWRIAPSVRLLAGYSGFYWSRVQRPADQIDRRVNPAQVPISATFAPGTVSSVPQFGISRTDFWAQGLNVGIELRY